MTALWQDPIRATTTQGLEPVLLIGVVTETYAIGEETVTATRFLMQDRDGGFDFVDIAGVVGNWRYGTIPDGDRAGQLGWYDLVPEGEEPVNPIDEDDDGP